MDKGKGYSINCLILKELLNGDLNTLNSLSKILGMSEKTLRTRLKKLNEFLGENRLGYIESKPGIGITLTADEEQRKKILLFTEKSNNDYSLNYQERFVKTMKLILYSTKNNPKTTQSIAESLYISTPTAQKIINECNSWLSMFKLKLRTVRNKGIAVVGSEVAYRLAFKHFITGFEKETNIELKLSGLLSDVYITKIKACILETEKEWNFKLAEDSFDETLIYCCLAVARNKEHPIYLERSELVNLQAYSEYSFAKVLFNKLYKLTNITLSDEEVGFLSIQILCSRLIQSYSDDTKLMLREFDTKLNEFVGRIIKVVSEVVNVDLTNDEYLFKGLINHIKPCIFRLRYGRGYPNSMTGYIKNEYLQTFRVSWLVSVLFEEYFNLKVTEDELGYIALYIQSALERNQREIDMLYVSNGPMGFNQLMVEKIKRKLPNIKDIKITSTHEYENSQNIDYKLIVSTEKLDEKTVLIDETLSNKAINNIDKAIKNIFNQDAEKLKFDIITHQLFDPDLILVDLKIKNKEQLIEMMCHRLVLKGYVNASFYKSVMDREAITPTSIGNMIAIPHGDQAYINEAKVFVAILKEPIKWDSDEVDIVCLLAVKMSNELEIKKTQTFYKGFINIMENKDEVNKIKSFKSEIELYKYLIR